MRLEEQPDSNDVNPMVFYARSAWINRREIANAFLQARPWQFPFWLGRLTVASMSTMLLMLLSAEAWDLGMVQTTRVSLFLPVLAVVVTTLYVIYRQNLLLRRTPQRVSEQIFLTNVSTCAIVAGGMLATFLSVFVCAILIMLLLFQQSLAGRWAESIAGSVQFAHYCKLGAFVASIGLGVGSLGASFEGQDYFRYVTYVDEEI